MKKPNVAPFRWIVIFATLSGLILTSGQADTLDSPRVFLAGNNARLLSVLTLSDGTILAGGSAADLEWVPKGVPIIDIPAAAANGWNLPASDSDDGGRRSVLLHLSADLGQVLAVAAFPSGLGGSGIAAIKTDSVPGSKTGSLYIAGGSSTPKTYWLGKLDANFLDGRPTKLSWGYDHELGRIGKVPIDAIWDVGGDGKIVFYNNPKNDWGVVCRLKADGSGLDSVPNWRSSHGRTQPDGSEAKILSLKTGSGDLRSRTWAEFEALTPDGNGGLRKGSFPDDLYYSQPIEAGNEGRGYTGYRSRNTAASTACIAVDRRSNDFFVGYNVQSILPPWSPIPNAPDFEPTLVAFTSQGGLRWWSRMYSEIDPKAGPFVSTDAGDTWKVLGEGFVYGAANAVERAGEIIYVAENAGVSRLSGGRWELFSKGIPSLPVMAIAVDNTGKTVFAGTIRGDLVRSRDGGVSWTLLPVGSSGKKRPAVSALAVHPANSKMVYCAFENGDRFLSEDDGENWKPFAESLPLKSVREFTFHPKDPSTIFALGKDGLFKSADSGTTWTDCRVPGNNFTGISLDPTNPDMIFVSSYNKSDTVNGVKMYGIRVSADGGATWTEEKVGNSKINDVFCLPGGTEVFCVSGDRGLFKREASGSNQWTRLNLATGLEKATNSMTRLLGDPSAPGTVCAFSQGAGFTSTPDQYVDAVAVDYSQPASESTVVVMARSHGNEVSNFWHGKEGGSFMRRQTGTSGNEHYHWIARFGAATGQFINATWFVGLDPFGSNFGKRYEDGNLADWPDHNAGNANLKGAQGRSLGVGLDGKVYAAGTTRAGISTSNAFQKMTSPLDGKAPWHDFFRVHSADLSTVTYATALTGTDWDTEKGEGAGNTRIAAVAALVNGGIVAVGSHNGTGNTIPTANVPSWGKSTPEGETMMLGIFP